MKYRFFKEKVEPVSTGVVLSDNDIPAGMPLTNRLDRMTREQARWAIQNGNKWLAYLRENEGEIFGVSENHNKS